MKHKLIYKKGLILAPVLVFASVAILFVGAIISWTGSNIRSAQNYRQKEMAMNIADSGINYYRWHLAHAQTDYTDGTNTPGPYVHAYYDKDNVRIGQFALTIIPPPLGSSLVTVIATGTVDANPKLKRVVRAQFAKPSIAKYATVANDNMRFGAGTEIYGLLHSNGGIRFDGIAHNLVTSALSTYTDPDFGGIRYAVYTQDSPADPSPPTAITNNRLDVFMAGRQYPVPSVDFVGITSNINSMKTAAASSSRWWGTSGQQGYRVVLKINDTFDLYRVTGVTTLPSACGNDATSQSQAGWGSWTISTQSSLVGNYSFPTSTGVIFFEDNVWVDGQIDGARLTIVAARPGATSNYPNIIVNNDVQYTNYDGNDVLALIAQGDFRAGFASENDLRIDAAIIAQNGRVGRYYYNSSCGASYIRNSLTLYGMIATNLRYGFAYTNGTGYNTRTINYDANLLYAPPPSFPLTSDQYSLVSWQEIQ